MGFSLVAACRGYSLVVLHRRLIVVASLVVEHRLSGTQVSVSVCGLTSCGSWALENRADRLWHMGLVDPWYVGSSWGRDQICISCTGRQFFTRAIREA